MAYGLQGGCLGFSAVGPSQLIGERGGGVLVLVKPSQQLVRRLLTGCCFEPGYHSSR
jgi:hypothetical protein